VNSYDTIQYNTIRYKEWPGFYMLTEQRSAVPSSLPTAFPKQKTKWSSGKAASAQAVYQLSSPSTESMTFTRSAWYWFTKRSSPLDAASISSEKVCYYTAKSIAVIPFYWSTKQRKDQDSRQHIQVVKFQLPRVHRLTIFCNIQHKTMQHSSQKPYWQCDLNYGILINVIKYLGCYF